MVDIIRFYIALDRHVMVLLRKDLYWMFSLGDEKTAKRMVLLDNLVFAEAFVLFVVVVVDDDDDDIVVDLDSIFGIVEAVV